MVGRDISDKCYPNTIRMGKDMSNGTLILNVVHGNELSIEYSKQLIIDKINSFFGYNCVKEIKLKIIQEKRIKSNFKSIKKTRKYENKLDQIENEKIKNSLNNLIKAYNDKTE